MDGRAGGPFAPHALAEVGAEPIYSGHTGRCCSARCNLYIAATRGASQRAVHVALWLHRLRGAARCCTVVRWHAVRCRLLRAARRALLLHGCVWHAERAVALLRSARAACLARHKETGQRKRANKSQTEEKMAKKGGPHPLGIAEVEPRPNVLNEKETDEVPLLLTWAGPSPGADVGQSRRRCG